MQRMRIPSRVKLPFGYEIKVKIFPKTKLLEVDPDPADGLWDVNTRTIYISKSLTHTEQIGILSHEMLHAMADWNLWVARGRR